MKIIVSNRTFWQIQGLLRDLRLVSEISIDNFKRAGIVGTSTTEDGYCIEINEDFLSDVISAVADASLGFMGVLLSAGVIMKNYASKLEEIVVKHHKIKLKKEEKAA